MIQLINGRGQLGKKLTQKFHVSDDWIKTDKLLLSTKKIYSYIGYTTLMDIEILSCESYLIASPGQLEQEYLEKISKKKS
jgi:hypothetical protein